MAMRREIRIAEKRRSWPSNGTSNGGCTMSKLDAGRGGRSTETVTDVSKLRDCSLLSLMLGPGAPEGGRRESIDKTVGPAAAVLPEDHLPSWDWGEGEPSSIRWEYLDDLIDTGTIDFEVLTSGFHNLVKEQKRSQEARCSVFPIGEELVHECYICFDRRKLRRRPCCQFPVCPECMKGYLITQVQQGIVKIECLSIDCESYVHRDEVLFLLPPEMKSKYYKFLVDANRDPYIKTCPRCSHIMKLKREKISLKTLKKGFKVACPVCQLPWCFPCQTPWHEGISCKQLKKGDKLLKSWSQEYHYGQINAQKCPKCKIFIQRTTGCDHMTCGYCGTNFCYRCGDRFRGIKFFGDHYSKLSIFGCKYRLLPEKSTSRKLIRGTLFGGKLLAALFLGGLALGAGGALLSFGAVILPMYGGYKLHKHIKHKRYTKMMKRHINFYSVHSEKRDHFDQYQESCYESSSEQDIQSEVWVSQHQSDLSVTSDADSWLTDDLVAEIKQDGFVAQIRSRSENGDNKTVKTTIDFSQGDGRDGFEVFVQSDCVCDSLTKKELGYEGASTELGSLDAE